MTFRQKLVAYSAAVTALVAAVPHVSAQEIALQYSSYPIGSAIADEYWSDLANLSVQRGLHVPEVLVADFAAPDGHLTVTVLVAMGACGLNECPVRIFKGDRKIADFNACYNTTTHAMNSTGSLFIACDDVIGIGRN